MAFVSLSLKTVARLAAVLLVVSTVVLPCGPGFAASPRFQFGNGDMPRFNIDPNPCGFNDQRGHGRRFGGEGCPGGPPRFSHRGNGGQRGPGSNAFGLQFDNDGY